MSVLENNSTKMADILAAVNALPDAGSGGGGASVETCALSLTIECYMSSRFHVVATSVDDDGNIIAYHQSFYLESENSQTITVNVLQGSAVGIISNMAMSMDNSISPGATIIAGFDSGTEAVIQVGAETSANWTVIFA